MNSKLMIVRVVRVAETEQIIRYLESSLSSGREHYYIVNDVDVSAAESNNGLNCLAAFVIFNPYQQGEPNEITRLFIGEGHIVEKNNTWRIEYTIVASFESEMIINNFISNSELDINEDYGSQSYLMIEDNAGLVKQLSDLMYKPDDNILDMDVAGEYPSIDRERILHEYSQKNEFCKRPYIESTPFRESRSEFQHDYERIIHSKAFRRLVDKAQIFTSAKGDHYRTRMTHTLEVAQIARGIARELNLNVELTEAIALAHDLGHTPFGHQGERTLDSILKGRIDILEPIPDEENECNCNKGNFYGGFKHNFQGLRVANYLEEKYVGFDGLNLSYQVLEGILKHTSVNIKKCEGCDRDSNAKCFDLADFLPNGDVEDLYPAYSFATTLEGQIVKIADEIAQRSHDLDDALAAKLINIDQLRSYCSLHKTEAFSERLKEVQEELERAEKNHHMFVSEESLLRSRIVSIVISHFIGDVVACSKVEMENFEPDEFYQSNHRYDHSFPLRFKAPNGDETQVTLTQQVKIC